MITSSRLLSVMALSLAACAPTLPFSTGNLSAPAVLMQESDPGASPVSECLAPSCSAPGIYVTGESPQSAVPHHGKQPFSTIMHHMHQKMPTATGDVDTDFLAGMIPHHKAAIDMARVELMHGHDPFARMLAQNILASQSAEILQMRQLLQRVPARHHDKAAQQYTHIMHAMHGTMPNETGQTDVDFMRGMIPHHQAAVDMANVILDHGRDPYVRRLALDIIGSQQSEISQMNAWLKRPR